MRRRIVPAAVLVVVVGAGIFSAAAPSGQARITRCPLAALRVSLQTQGTATQSLTNVILGNPERLRCSFSEPVVFEVEQHGHRAAIVGNPLRVTLREILRGTRRGYTTPDVWWANWCGSRHGLRMTVRVASHVLSTRFNVLPLCLAPTQKSTLYLPTH